MKLTTRLSEGVTPVKNRNFAYRPAPPCGKTSLRKLQDVLPYRKRTTGQGMRGT